MDGEGALMLLSHASDLDGAHHLDAGGNAGAKGAEAPRNARPTRCSASNTSGALSPARRTT